MEWVRDYARPMIAALLIVGGFLIYYLVATGRCPQEWKDVMLIIIGAIIPIYTSIVQYYFGSSQGSADKTQIMAKAINGNKPQP